MAEPQAATSSLQKLLSGAQLPALPQSAIRVLEISRSPNNGPAEMAVAIESDPGLATQVLKFVNSSYFGFSREISSAKLAITLVGMKTINNFVLWSAVFSLVPNPKCGPFDLRSLWQDCLRRGLFARLVGKRLKLPEAEDLFAAALLQDMAIPLLAKVLPKDYCELLSQREGGKTRLSVLEQARFGWNHADAAAQLAMQWNFPSHIVDLLRQHPLIDEIGPNEAPGGRFAVALSGLLPASSDDSWSEVQLFEQHFQRITTATGLSVIETLEQVDREFSEFAPMLKIADGGNGLLDQYQRAAQPA